MKAMTLAVLCLLGLPALGCGSDEDDQASTFACGEDDANRCQKNTEYCLETVEGDTPTGAACHAVPDGCTDCDCIQTDDPVETSCESFTICTSVGTSVFRVECDTTPAGP